MNVGQLIELLKEQPQDALIIDDNPEASDEGLGHWYIPRCLHLTGVEAEKIGGINCIRLTYSESNEGWQDDCWKAISTGRFFKAHGLDKDDFAYAGEEVPLKDGNYLCVCKHGERYTLETQSFYAQTMPDGRKREKSQWGWSCEHIPPQFGAGSYPVALWSRKSFKPFGGT